MIPELVARIDAGLRARGTPERAEHERAYLKSDLDFYGASVPAMRAVVRDALAGTGPLGHAAAVAAAEALWAEPVHERRMAAVELLERCVGALGAVREAVKPLTDAQRAAILAARRR